MEDGRGGVSREEEEEEVNDDERRLAAEEEEVETLGPGLGRSMAGGG